MEPITQVDDYDAVTARLLRQTTDELRRERDALRAELHEAQGRIAVLEGRIAVLEGRTAALEGGLAWSEAARRGLETHLGALQSGLGWAILQRFRGAKARVFRPGSAVERAYGRLTQRLARRIDKS